MTIHLLGHGSSAPAGGPLLVSDRGTPVPPQDVLKALRDLDDRFGLEWQEGCAAIGLEGHWSLTVRWSESDSRRRFIQQGTLPKGSDKDRIGGLPKDCDVRQAVAFIRNHARRLASRDDMQRTVSRIEEWNTRQMDAVMQQGALDYGEELIEASAAKIMRDLTGETIPKLYLSSDGSSSNRKRKRGREWTG